MRTHLRSYFATLFAGDLAAFGAPPTDEALAGHIRAEQVSLVLGYSFGIMLANACNEIDGLVRQDPISVEAFSSYVALNARFHGAVAKNSLQTFDKL